MQIACLGGGPGGLYFAISLKLQNPLHDITVFERNKPDDTFGWGVVLSDDTLHNLQANDPISEASIRNHFAYWDDIALHYKGKRLVSSGHGFCGIGRKKLLNILQERARSLEIKMKFETEVEDVAELAQTYDLVVASDGLNSRTRNEFQDAFQPKVDKRLCHFVWLGTHQKFDDAFTFIFEPTKFGWIWAHAYQFDQDTATFIVECSQETFNAFGFGEMTQQESIEVCEKIFAEHLDGHPLMTNASHIRGSAWIRFPRILCESWSYRNIVLLGDAAATAHFSIGSGTKLALESAIALAYFVHSEHNLSDALEKYEEARRVEVLRLQSAARNSVEWFENVERYLQLDPMQLNYSLLTRSQRISHENLRMRDGDWLQSAEKWFQEQAGVSSNARTRPPMFAPFKLRDMDLKNRIVVSPMAQYKAVNGCPTDWHFVHYGERAKGGAGLVYTEMTCVSDTGRISPGCPGLYDNQHLEAWSRLTQFVHKETDAKICCQIGHSGRKGSTRIGWEGMDEPLPSGNWEVVSASTIPWSPKNSSPREASKADLDEIKNQFVAATEMANEADFDMIELHAAHGYFISSFVSSISNKRTDAYGGTLENRMRYPMDVLRAMRSVWPDHKPISVRISATDWLDDKGVTPKDAVQIAKMFAEAGADIINVSAGQTSTEAEPVYGRMFQTPLSDRIRNDGNLKTIAVGNIYEADHVNSILLAGRADLVCIGRPHLSDPYWTLHRATEIGDREEDWPSPYLQGRDQLWRLADREAEQANQV